MLWGRMLLRPQHPKLHRVDLEHLISCSDEAEDNRTSTFLSPLIFKSNKMVSAFEILDIVELIFFFPAFFASAYCVYKNGHRKLLAWRCLLMVCLFRLIGAITSLISIHHPSSGLTITYDIMNSFGLSAILSTALGLLDRINSGMDGHGVHPRVFQLLHLPSLAGLILSILGSTHVFSSDPSDVATGFTYLKAAVCLFLSVFVADIIIVAISFLRSGKVQSGDRQLLFAVGAALPFMAVRMTFSLLCVFANDPKWFSSWSLERDAVIVHGVMGVLMEVCIVTIVIFAGLKTPPFAKPLAHEGKVTYNVEARSV